VGEIEISTGQWKLGIPTTVTRAFRYIAADGYQFDISIRARAKRKNTNKNPAKRKGNSFGFFWLLPRPLGKAEQGRRMGAFQPKS